MDRQKRHPERVYQLVGKPEQGALDVRYLWYSAADLQEPASSVAQQRRIQEYAERHAKRQPEPAVHALRAQEAAGCNW